MRKLFPLLGILIFVILAQGYYPHDARIKKRVIVATAKKVILGVVVKDLDEKDKEELKVESGAKIEKVLEDSEAERIGLREDDVIVRFDGQEVRSARALKEMVSEIKDEKTVKITVVRDGKEKTFEAKIKPQEPEDVCVKIIGEDEDVDVDVDDEVLVAPEFPDIKKFFWVGSEKGAFLGVHAINISKQLLEYFEVDHGVLIEKVIKDSPAEKAGLKAGDVITEIGNRKVRDFEDLIRIMNYYDPGDKVTVYFTRKGKKNFVEVELGKKPHHRIFKKRFRPDKDFFFYQFHDIPKKLRMKLNKLRDLDEKLEELVDINIELFIL